MHAGKGDCQGAGILWDQHFLGDFSRIACVWASCLSTTYQAMFACEQEVVAGNQFLDASPYGSFASDWVIIIAKEDG